MTEMQNHDLLLIERFRAGDSSGFNALITKHQARAYQYAHRLTKDVDQASDVVAEAFVRVFKALPNFKGDSSFTTWLYRILTNCYLDMLKKQRSRPSISLDAAYDTEEGELYQQIEDPSFSPHREAEMSESERTIGAAVQALPPYQKAMVLMYHAQMLSYDEIAQALSLPVGTVKSRLNRARITLRQMLTHQLDLAAA